MWVGVIEFIGRYLRRSIDANKTKKEKKGDNWNTTTPANTNNNKNKTNKQDTNWESRVSDESFFLIKKTIIKVLYIPYFLQFHFCIL
jgi:hypothetical protein